MSEKVAARMATAILLLASLAAPTVAIIVVRVFG